MSEHRRAGGMPPTPDPSPTGSPTGGEGWGRGETRHQPRDPSWERWEVPSTTRRRMRDIARELRKDLTESESLLWEHLRGGLDGRKFRRQPAIGTFVVDFYCASERLVVEVDGGVHEQQREKDEQRQEALERLGLRFVRVPHEQVMNDVGSALATIRRAFAGSAPLLHPSPPVGEGPGVGGTEAADRTETAESPPFRPGVFDDPAARWMARMLRETESPR